MDPVAPNPSPEAVELLRYLYSISGRGILAGQHNVPLLGSLRLTVAQRMAGHYPALFGQDFGFDHPGTWDGINFRQNIVDECIRRHGEGFIITLMWHAVRPTDDEPGTFDKSVMCRLTDEQWLELVTAGSPLNERWKSQVDVVAWHLKQLRDARVPVLWRPYHEMNGGWFWWGRSRHYVTLWNMLFDRLAVFHGLNNLLWVYNPNEVGKGNAPYAEHYPGHDRVDVLATDVYREGYARREYEELMALAGGAAVGGGKPIALGETGTFPPGEVLREQPNWCWFMYWHDVPGGEEAEKMKRCYAGPTTITHDKLPWVKVRSPRMHHPILK